MENTQKVSLTDEQCEHLRHMTDGRWHDNCKWCLRRRVHGGSGLEDPATICPRGGVGCYVV
jgi:hypothetical protein